jgi:hypothetical protein
MSAQANKPPRRKAFMLHFWEERLGQGAQASVWRCRLEDPHSGKIQTFADLNALMRFLQAETSAHRLDGEAAESASGSESIVQRLQRKFMPLSDVQLGGAAAGAGEPEPAELDEQPPDDGPTSTTNS